MKRDPQIVRKILLEMETSEVNHFEEKLAIRGVLSKADTEQGKQNRTRAEHIRWMMDEGLIGMVPGSDVHVRVTAKGCDFLDAVRNDKIWKRTLDKLKVVGGEASLDVIKSIASKILLSVIESGLNQ
ncbi:DUF2513 domain-containing protein [Celeribacter halophilus]|uniref:DUF2513 domain-containing protein n=1 Tax=Celeribacter halophilus TaxID=576117 RepID=UPI003A8F38B6